MKKNKFEKMLNNSLLVLVICNLFMAFCLANETSLINNDYNNQSINEKIGDKSYLKNQSYKRIVIKNNLYKINIENNTSDNVFENFQRRSNNLVRKVAKIHSKVIRSNNPVSLTIQDLNSRPINLYLNSSSLSKSNNSNQNFDKALESSSNVSNESLNKNINYELTSVSSLIDQIINSTKETVNNSDSKNLDLIISNDEISKIKNFDSIKLLNDSVFVKNDTFSVENSNKTYNESFIDLKQNISNIKLNSSKNLFDVKTFETTVLPTEILNKRSEINMTEANFLNESIKKSDDVFSDDEDLNYFDVDNKKDDKLIESSIVDNNKVFNSLENKNSLDKSSKKFVEDNKSKDNIENSNDDKNLDNEKIDKVDKSIDEIKTNKIHNSNHVINDDEENDEEDEDDEKNESKTNNNDKEAESLLKLQSFLQDTVEKALKSALPLLVKSGYETNISSSCTSSFLSLTRGLQNNKQWAFKMLDASGKPPSGILDGTLTDYGAFEECLSVNTFIEQPDDKNHFTGKYCVLDLKPSLDRNIPLGSNPPFGIKNDSVIWSAGLQIFWSRNSLLSFRYGLCSPSSCSRKDLDAVAKYFFKPAGMEAEVNYCQLSKDQHADVLQIIIMAILFFILFIVFIGTILEQCLLKFDKQHLVLSKKRSLVDFLVCFSFIRNSKKLFINKKSDNKNQLEHLNGVRFISTCWIIMGHTYFYTDFVHYHHFRSLAHFKFLDDSFWFMPIANFTLSVDTYFFISGFLIVYANWKKLKISNGKINIIEFLLHRVWRIWPAYLVTIAITLILPLFGSGPLWPEAVKNSANVCKKNWWYNVLFINNFQKPDEVCMFHTWFLSANLQFHLLALPFLFILYRYPKFCFSLFISSILACIGGVFYYAQINNLTIPAVIADDVFVDFDQKILTLYIMPYYHFASYILGMMVGYYLINNSDKRFSRKYLSTFWVLSIIILAVVIYLPHNSFRGEITSLIFSSSYLSLHRVAWSIAFGWLVFACSTGQGHFINSILSYSLFRPLSSLSYLAYLIHPVLMVYHTGSVRERVNLGHYQLLNTFLARVVLSFTSAYLLYTIIELPFTNIEKYIFFFKKQKSQKLSIQKTSQISNKNKTDNLRFYETGLMKSQFKSFDSIKKCSCPSSINCKHNFLRNDKLVNISNYSNYNQHNSNFNQKVSKNYNVPSFNKNNLNYDNVFSLDRNLVSYRKQLNHHHLNTISNDNDKKYFLYKQRPINQYFYSGSITNTLTSANTINDYAFNKYYVKHLQHLNQIKISKQNQSLNQENNKKYLENQTKTSSSSIDFKDEKNQAKADLSVIPKESSSYTLENKSNQTDQSNN